MSIATKMKFTGKRNSVYAADLASLREMEKKINKDMDDLLITDASVKKLTVNTLFERYMATKNIKERTKKNYIRMWDYRIQNTLGNIHVVDFKTSHVRTFFSTLSDEGLAHSTIKGLYGLLNPSFELAVEDGIIRKESGNRNTWRLWGSGKREGSTDTGTAGKTFGIC